MRILVLGGAGMLGHKLWQELSPRHDVTVTVRSGPERLPPVGELIHGAARIVDHVGTDDASLERALRAARPECVINALGVVKQADGVGRDEMYEVNARFPHRVAARCRAGGARLIQLSTDCVFAGTRGRYTESDPPDPVDDYGRSKLEGEVVNGDCLTIRTSMIGRELVHRRGLVEWFLAERGKRVRGYTRAIFSGLPTLLLARVIADVIERHPALRGIHHVAAGPIAKCDLLSLLRAAYHLEVTIEPFDGVVVDRSLDGSRFRTATGFVAPAWPEMIRLLASDPTPYDRWRLSRGA